MWAEPTSNDLVRVGRHALGPARSSGPRRSTTPGHSRHWGNATDACATPAAPADRSTAGPPTRPPPGPSPRRRPARPTARRRHPRLDMHDHRVLVLIVDDEHVHRQQAHQQLAHALRVGLYRGSPARLASEPPDSQSPCAASGGPSARAHTPLRSEAPDFERSLVLHE
jgi:hypothetical protein